jgi:membrane protease YdiL (CAAX protease family)
MKLPVLWDNLQTDAVLALANVTFGFITYWFVSQSPVLERRFKAKYTENYSLPWVIFQRYTGVLFLGVLPAIITFIFSETPFKNYGISLEIVAETFYWIAGLAIIILPMNYLNAQKPDNLATYPQIRLSKWSVSTFVHEYSSWIAYLLAYELLFRGFLLYGCASAMGTVVAIVLNTAIYAIAHIPKGQKETIGAIPLGALLSYLTFQTGTVWLAVGVHITLALSNSFFSFLAHKDMSFKK